MKKFSVLMVCTGNICRSPTAHVYLEKAIEERALSDFVSVDSAGTDHWHIGEPPDTRSMKHALRRGMDMSHLRARQLSPNDYEDFDLLLAMDRGHYRRMTQDCPPKHIEKVKMYLDFSMEWLGENVADPYYGGDAGFEMVLDQVEQATDGLMDYIKEQLDKAA